MEEMPCLLTPPWLLQCLLLQDSGQTLTISTDSNATIQELLELVDAKDKDWASFVHESNNTVVIEDEAAKLNGKAQKLRPLSRYLQYGGVPLRPSRTLRDYGIQDLATLETSVRLHGGCFSVSIFLWIVIFICCLLSICTCGLSLPIALCLLPLALLLPLCCL